jgi:predicted acylesterase/phospholipase RssA
MGVTIIQKSDLSRPKRNPRIGLSLAGGAISGGAFKLGGLIALNSFFVNRKITEFDLYLGISAGAFLAGPISAGIAPEELFLSLSGNSTKIDQFKPTDFYWPNYHEFVGKPMKLGRDALAFLPQVAGLSYRFLRRNRRDLSEQARTLVDKPTLKNLESLLEPLILDILKGTDLPHVFSYLPTGVFDNSRIEKFMRRNLESNGLPNNFRLMHLERKNSLYICATNLDTAEGVVFGHDEDDSLSISQAVQASTAIPGFFRPAHFNGVDYVDAAIRKTANISTIVGKGADLIIAYNPFRPFVNTMADEMLGGVRSISDMGFISVLNQTFRTLLASRLRVGLDRLRMDPSFNGDVILIEPSESDLKFFNMNPLAFWNRHDAALHGFKSVKRSLEQNYPKLVRILKAYGITTDLDDLRESALSMGIASHQNRRAGHDDSPAARLRVVK